MNSPSAPHAASEAIQEHSTEYSTWSRNILNEDAIKTD